jgi:hypothetical protein
VKEQRERQQLRGPDFLQDGREAGAAGARRVEQRLDVADGQQRVLVDGVLVVEVADHAAVDFRELGEDARQQTAVVHLGEARVQALPRPQHVAQLVPFPFRGDEIVRRAAVDVLLDAGERLFRHGAFAIDGNPERLQPERGL